MSLKAVLFSMPLMLISCIVVYMVSALTLAMPAHRIANHVNFKLQVYSTSCSPPLPVCLDFHPFFFSASRLLMMIPFCCLPPNKKDIFADTYHFSTGIGGLAYIGMGVGFVFGVVFGSKTADRIYKRVSKAKRFFCFLYYAKLTGLLFNNFFFLLLLTSAVFFKNSFPIRMVEWVLQKCGFQHCLLDRCSFLLVFCKLVFFFSFKIKNIVAHSI